MGMVYVTDFILAAVKTHVMFCGNKPAACFVFLIYYEGRLPWRGDHAYLNAMVSILNTSATTVLRSGMPLTKLIWLAHP